MPIGNLKNTIYGLALPVLGRPTGCKRIAGGDDSAAKAAGRTLRKNHTVGAAVQRFENGKLTDRWIHEKTPLFSRDGGHGMVFRTFEGQLMFTYHTPNNTPFERPAFLPLEEKDGALVPKE